MSNTQPQEGKPVFGVTKATPSSNNTDLVQDTIQGSDPEYLSQPSTYTPLPVEAGSQVKCHRVNIGGKVPEGY